MKSTTIDRELQGARAFVIGFSLLALFSLFAICFAFPIRGLGAARDVGLSLWGSRTHAFVESGPDSGSDSKRLVVHGPFKYPPDDSAPSGQGARMRLRPRDDRSGLSGASDDYEDKTPGPEC